MTPGAFLSTLRPLINTAARYGLLDSIFGVVRLIVSGDHEGAARAAERAGKAALARKALED
jgi:hypothetical protein